MWLAALPLWLAAGLSAAEQDAWERDAFIRLCTKYLGATPQEGASNSEWLDRLLRQIGERLAASGTTGAPAEDIALAALLQARAPAAAAKPMEPASGPQPSKTGVREEQPIRQQSDISRGQEGIRQAQERLAELPIAERLVLTGDVASVLQVATVPKGPDLTTTVGRARVNFVLKALSAESKRPLGDGFFFVQMQAAGGAFDSSVVGGPASFSALNDIAVDRSRFNESTSRGNLYLSKVFYEQNLNLGESRVLGRVGIIDRTSLTPANSPTTREQKRLIENLQLTQLPHSSEQFWQFSGIRADKSFVFNRRIREI